MGFNSGFKGLNNEPRCLSFESSLAHVFMTLLANLKWACRKMYTTISVIQLFGFFQRTFFIAAQRILPFITPSRYPDPLLRVCTIIRTLCTGNAWWQRAEIGSLQ